jgi:hypothetical protein
MKRVVLILVLLLLPSLALAEGILTPAANPPISSLYDYRTSVELQEEFSTGSNGSGTIGALGWGFTGGTPGVNPAGEANHPGVFRMDTSATISTLAQVVLSKLASQYDPAQLRTLFFIMRLNTNDANTTLRVGEMANFASNPTTNGIYVEKLDGDTNWFCVTRAASAQTRVDSAVAVSTSFVKLEFSRTTSGVQFRIDGVPVCGVMTTNLPSSVFQSPGFHIINSAAAAKTVDVDYFQMNITGLNR